MRSDVAALPVAIVGGGFSGTMTAAQLARRGVASVLIDGSGRMGRGVAYSTTEDVHLLNVPSGKMSAWPDAPTHFAEWLGDDGSSFGERRAFGRYLGSMLDETPGVLCIDSAAVSAERTNDGWRLRLADGRLIRASALALANGNQAPVPLRVAEGVPADLFVNNPWAAEAKQAIARVAAGGGDVLVLGTGLTMIDTVLSLVAAGHEGRITALSRRGLVPKPHAPHEPVAVEWDELPVGDLLTLWRWVRRRSAEVGFRAAVDSLRPHSQRLWQELGHAEQRRFLRHARPWWDVHRHRIAPEIGRQLQHLIADGRLTIVPGRVQSLQVEGGGLVAAIQRRGSRSVREERFAAAFNCTGPLGEMRRTSDPLLRQLLDEGAIRVDRLGMGLEVDARSRAGAGIWAVGPLTKGRYWEIVAVPDIRGQVAAVADELARELVA
jgi:uncharacterized NAD(P)/FAD-binding protein YdhS